MRKSLHLIIALSFLCSACTWQIPDSLRTQYAQKTIPTPPPSKESSVEEVFSLYKDFIGDAAYTTQSSASAQIQAQQVTTLTGTKLIAVKKTDQAQAYYTQIDDPTILHQHGFEQEEALAADSGIGSQWGFVKRLPENKMQILLISYSFPAPAMENESKGQAETPESMTYEIFLSVPVEEFPLR